MKWRRRALELQVMPFVALLSFTPSHGHAAARDVERLLAAGDYKKAYELAAADAEALPKDARAQFLHAHTCLVVGKGYQAVEPFRKALQLQPSLRADIGTIFLDAARKLYVSKSPWPEYRDLVQTYLKAARSYGYPPHSDTDEWIKRVTAEMVQEGLADSLAIGATNAKARKTMGQIRTLAIAMEAYAIEFNRYPLVASKGIHDVCRALAPKYLRECPTTDAWGTPFLIQVSMKEDHYRIISAGTDAMFQTHPSLDKIPKMDSYPGSGSVPDYARDLVYVDGRFVQWWSLSEP